MAKRTNMTVGELKKILSFEFKLQYLDRDTCKYIDYNALSNKEKSVFRENPVYKIIPTEDPKSLVICVS